MNLLQTIKKLINYWYECYDNMSLSQKAYFWQIITKM